MQPGCCRQLPGSDNSCDKVKMLSLNVKSRQAFGKKAKALRKKGLLPAIVYGPKTRPISIELDYKDFERAYKEAGESSLIKLELSELNKNYLVLIHEIEREPMSGKISHVDFYQAPLTEEIEVKIPLIFEGEAPAVKELGGTLVKNIFEIEVKGLVQNLPKEIKVNVNHLKSFDDNILIKDLKVPAGIKVLKDREEIIAHAAPPERIEEELKKPIEEKVEEVEKVEKITKEKEETETGKEK